MTSLRIGMDGDALRVPLSGVGHYVLTWLGTSMQFQGRWSSRFSFGATF
jgi:hypothetical protein